jgi:hypothetical protein
MLRRAFLDTVSVLYAYLETITGSVLSRDWMELSSVFQEAQGVFQTEAVASAFGLPPAPQDWPLAGNYDGGGAALIDEISKRTPNELSTPISQKKFLVLQRIALHGAQTLRGILTLGNNPSIDTVRELIGSAYAWETAMRGLDTATVSP